MRSVVLLALEKKVERENQKERTDVETVLQKVDAGPVIQFVGEGVVAFL